MGMYRVLGSSLREASSRSHPWFLKFIRQDLMLSNTRVVYGWFKAFGFRAVLQSQVQHQDVRDVGILVFKV